MSSWRYPSLLLAVVLAAWAWSGIDIQDTRLTWFLETAPVLLALPVLVLSARRFRLTTLVYTLIAAHAVVLMVGGHYSYAKVPLGFWMADWFGWTRNNYDKIGHLMQGFVPVLVTREILIRMSPLRGSRWLAPLCLAVAMAISALYEIIEWLAALADPGDTEAFLGTQGYVWDTQTDMAFCLVGAVLALLCLSRLHDRQLARRIGLPGSGASAP